MRNSRNRFTMKFFSGINISARQQMLLRMSSVIFCGGALFYSLSVLWFKIAEVSGIYYETALHSTPGTGTLAMIAAAGALAVVMLTLPWRVDWGSRLAKWENVLRPALLLWVIPMTKFPWTLFAVIILSFVVSRCCNEINFKLPEIPRRYLIFIMGAGFLLLTAWGYYVQVKAYDSLYFIYGDWNQYSAHYSHLLSGRASFVQWFSGAGHWNFGVNLLMCAASKLWYAPDTIFLVNALVIASAIPLGGWLGSKCKLNSWTILSILPIVILNPVLSNQFLSHFYGFHPIIFVVPLFMGFFIAREYKCRWAMAVMFVLSLLVQETVCIFWAGYAIYLLCCKRWKSGMALFAAMVGLFFFFSKVVIPAAHSDMEYSQMFHYAQLGSSMGEVLLSPLIRPGAFFGTLFERSSICFVLALLTPFFWGLIPNPKLLIAVVPLAAGVCLQDSYECKNVLFQYGVEISVFAMIVTVLNWKKMAADESPDRSIFHFCSLKKSVIGVLTATLLCGILLAFIPGNKGPASRILSRPDGGEMLDFITGAAGAFNRVIATSRIRGHFQFSSVDCDIRTDYAPGDVIILDLHDRLIDRQEYVETLRQKIAADKKVVPVTYCIWENHTIVMFKVLPQEVILPPIPWLQVQPEAEFDKFGTLIDIPVKYCKLRALYHNGQMIYRAMLMENSSLDIEFALNHKFADGSTKAVAVRFGNGLFPAYTAKPGTVFEFTVPCPPPQSIGGNIYKVEVERLIRFWKE